MVGKFLIRFFRFSLLAEIEETEYYSSNETEDNGLDNVIVYGIDEGGMGNDVVPEEVEKRPNNNPGNRDSNSVS